MAFDDLNASAQAAVLSAWEANVAAALARLDLAAVFAAEGHTYAELDQAGRIRVVAPGPSVGSGVPERH